MKRLLVNHKEGDKGTWDSQGKNDQSQKPQFDFWQEISNLIHNFYLFESLISQTSKWSQFRKDAKLWAAMHIVTLNF